MRHINCLSLALGVTIMTAFCGAANAQEASHLLPLNPAPTLKLTPLATYSLPPSPTVALKLTPPVRPNDGDAYTSSTARAFALPERSWTNDSGDYDGLSVSSSGVEVSLPHNLFLRGDNGPPDRAPHFGRHIPHAIEIGIGWRHQF